VLTRRPAPQQQAAASTTAGWQQPGADKFLERVAGAYSSGLVVQLPFLQAAAAAPLSLLHDKASERQPQPVGELQGPGGPLRLPSVHGQPSISPPPRSVSQVWHSLT
jgi:hypothetical protein